MPAVPLCRADARIAANVARAATEFGRLMRSIPVEEDAPVHSEVARMLRAFQALNRALAKRDARGYVTLASQARMGHEFQKLGAALLVAPTRARKKKPRR